MALDLSYALLSAFGLVFSAVAVLFVWVYITLSGLRDRIDASWKDLDFLINKKAEEVPYLLAAVKDYIRSDDQVIMSLIKANEGLVNAKTQKEKAQANMVFQGALASFLDSATMHPELKASESFYAFIKSLSSLEEQIAKKAGPFNDSVNFYNAKLTSPPTMYVAAVLRMKELELYRAD